MNHVSDMRDNGAPWPVLLMIVLACGWMVFLLLGCATLGPRDVEPNQTFHVERESSASVSQPVGTVATDASGWSLLSIAATGGGGAALMGWITTSVLSHRREIRRIEHREALQ